jgi:hypothetical protein
MRRWQPFVLLALAGGLVSACERGGTPVALNERIFDLPSMQSAGKGCTHYELRNDGLFDTGGSSGGGTVGGNVRGLVISQRSAGEFVLVQVTELGTVIAERRYGEGFFRSGTVDQLMVRGASGEQKMLRYWGAVAADGSPQCAPFDDDGNGRLPLSRY